MRLRCVIVDDSARFLDSARDLLEREGIAIVGVASTQAEALRQVEELRPECTLVDIHLGQESGLELARRLDDMSPAATSRVILISTHARADFADLIDASPAAGFLSKSELSARAIRSVLGAGSDAAGG